MRIALALLLTCLPLWAQVPQRVMQDLVAVAGMPAPTGGGEGPTYSPTNAVAGCVFWITSDSISAGQGDPISSVSDWSGLGNDATAVVDQEPTYNADQLNGYPSLYFTNAVLTANGVATNASGNGCDITIFETLKVVSQDQGSLYFWHFANSGSSTPYIGFSDYSSNLRLYLRARADAGDCTIGQLYSGGERDLTNYALVVNVITTTNWTVYTNGVQFAQGTTDTTCARTIDRFGIGATYGGTYGINADMVDMSIFAGALSSADRHYIETNYYAAKYGLPIVP